MKASWAARRNAKAAAGIRAADPSNNGEGVGGNVQTYVADDRITALVEILRHLMGNEKLQHHLSELAHHIVDDVLDSTTVPEQLRSTNL
jgi:hypothetical protein